MSTTPNSFDDLRGQIFEAAEVTYKPFSPATEEPEQVVKLPLNDLMKLIAIHRNAELEKLLEQDTYTYIDAAIGDKLHYAKAVPISAVKDLMKGDE